MKSNQESRESQEWMSLDKIQAIYLRNLNINTKNFNSSNHLIQDSLLDSYLTISIPKFDKILFKSNIQKSTLNPNFQIDLSSSSNLQSLIKINQIFQIQIWSKLENNQNLNQFNLSLNFLINLNNLIHLKNLNSDSLILQTENHLDQNHFNQLYFQSNHQIYLFKPILHSIKPTSNNININNNNNNLNHSINSSLNLKPWSLIDFINLLEKQLELNQTLDHLNQLESTLNQISNTHTGRQSSAFHLSRKLIEIDHHINVLNSRQTLSGIRLDELKAKLENRKKALDARRKINKTARLQLDEFMIQNIIKKQASYQKFHLPQFHQTQLQIARRRAQLVTQLNVIYPIEPTSIEDASLIFSIGNIILPTLEFNQPIANPSSLISFIKPLSLLDDDQTVSSALGFVAHLTKLIAHYLAVPILYPITCIGSRSLVLDNVSRIRGPRSFPLYFKGVDRLRFEYAVFLLNKDIEQIMYHRKVTISDLRHTLPNLKNLLLTLEPDLPV